MAAHNNLLDLMTQITNLESNISAIIMEFASKLSSLTDLHLFLALENREGRKVCGSPHLIESYAKGGFRPLRTDLLVDVESKQQRSLDDAVIRGDNSCVGADTNHIVVIDGDEPETRTHHSPHHNGMSASVILAEPVDVKPNLKRVMSRDLDSPRRKRSRGEASSLHRSEFVVSHLDHQMSASEDVGAEGALGGVGGGEMCIPDEDHLHGEGDPNQVVVVGTRRFQEHLFRAEDEDIFMLDFAELNLPEMKMDFLKNVENPLSLFEKGSVEVREFRRCVACMILIALQIIILSALDI